MQKKKHQNYNVMAWIGLLALCWKKVKHFLSRMISWQCFISCLSLLLQIKSTTLWFSILLPYIYFIETLREGEWHSQSLLGPNIFSQKSPSFSGFSVFIRVTLCCVHFCVFLLLNDNNSPFIWMSVAHLSCTPNGACRRKESAKCCVSFYHQRAIHHTIEKMCLICCLCAIVTQELLRCCKKWSLGFEFD